MLATSFGKQLIIVAISQQQPFASLAFLNFIIRPSITSPSIFLKLDFLISKEV